MARAMKFITKMQLYQYLLGIGTVVIFTIALFGIISMIQRAPHDVITQDIILLKNIFEKIDADCTILGFEQERTPINFLTVEKFIGSEVGGMKLANPRNWKGPYLRDNPTIQEKHYIILSRPDGIFITPDSEDTIAINSPSATKLILKKTDSTISLSSED